MDVYLSQNIQVQLETIVLLFPAAQGILSGHKQGQRYFVENITAVPGALTLPMKKHLHVQDLLQDAFLGYFSTHPLGDREKKLLSPAVMGKIILEVTTGPDQKDKFQAYVIDYDGTFLLTPIKIKKEKSRPRDVP